MALNVRRQTADAGKRRAADLGRIYAHAASMSLTHRNPIVFIPGLLGTRLVSPDSDETLWGNFGSAHRADKDGRLRRLMAMPMKQGVPLHDLGSASIADGTLQEASPRGLPITVSVYRDILHAVGVRGRAVAGEDQLEYGDNGTFASFEFSYDWRRSLDETAALLDDFLNQATYFVQAKRRNSEPVRFDIVAHSMGGLLLRYYLQYGAQPLAETGGPPRLSWGGCERVARAIVIGTPNAGSASAVTGMVSGMPARLLVHQGYDPLVVGTMPGLYQLLPRPRHKPLRGAGDQADLYDIGLWQKMGWGLAAPGDIRLLEKQVEGEHSEAELRAIALDHLDKCLRKARAFHAAMDRPVDKPDSLELHVVAGDAHPTVAQLSVDPASGKLEVAKYAAGDGTVLRSSVLLDERRGNKWRPGLTSPIPWDSITFADAAHMALTGDRNVMDNVLFKLLDAPRQ